MNRDASIHTATDAAAPAITDAPPAPSDVVELDDWYETDSELAEFALRQANAAASVAVEAASLAATRGAINAENPTADDLFTSLCEVFSLNAGPASSLVLVSRALMRSAAAHERMAAGIERDDRRHATAAAELSSVRAEQLKNLQLQNRALEAEQQCQRQIAGHTLGIVTRLDAGETITLEELQAFAKTTLELFALAAANGMSLATAAGD